MNDKIAYCGLDCGKCDAYIATKTGDQALREKTARRWSELNNATILPEHINCEGCRAEGVKTVYCSNMCQIRKCVMGRGYGSCGDCPEMVACPIVGVLHKNNPDARRNLENR